MIHDLKPYPTYKDSGVPWLGELPEHWEVKRLKQVCTRSALYGANIAASSYSPTGIRFLRTTDIREDGTLKSGGVHIKSEDALGYLLEDGDILISRSGTVGRSFLYNSVTHGSCAYAGYLVRFVLGDTFLPKFLLYFTRTPSFADFLKLSSIQSTIENVNGDKYANSLVPIPSLPEQSAIVRHLDYIDQRIRRYIRTKQKLIKLLEEQKQAIIHQAVTRGLDPNVKLKPSGVEWLGDVPEHWNTISLGAASELIQTGPFGSQLHSHEYIECGVPVINPSHMRNGRIVPDTSISISQSKADDLQRHKLQPGDIVAARRGELGRCALVTTIEEGWICGTGSLRICCKTTIFDPKYFLQLFSSQGIRDSLSISSIGATMDNLNAGMVARLRLPLPSLDEQRRIVAIIDVENRKSSMVISAIKHEISLLREYRTRLIADVVTGKLDVREAAANLPEELNETEILDEELVEDEESTEENLESEPEE